MSLSYCGAGGKVRASKTLSFIHWWPWIFTAHFREIKPFFSQFLLYLNNTVRKSYSSAPCLVRWGVLTTWSFHGQAHRSHLWHTCTMVEYNCIYTLDLGTNLGYLFTGLFQFHSTLYSPTDQRQIFSYSTIFTNYFTK